MSETIHELISEADVAAKIAELGAQISKDYEGEDIYMLCILKGGVFFMTELAKHVTVPVSLDFMSVSSYGSQTRSSGNVRIIKDLDTPIEGKNVLVVEDIIDTGRTLAYLLDNLQQRKPKSLKLCTLLDKPEQRVTEVDVDYVGFQIPDKFVVGYGLDYGDYYRNIPYVFNVTNEDR